MYAVSPLALRQGARVPGVIVELVGPSAAGKSTLARAIAEALPSARLAASARPAETASSGAVRLPPALARAAKITRALPDLLGRGDEDDLSARLMALLPPGGPIWRLRYRRYLAELDRRLRSERAAGGVVILDQGFVTAIGTLAGFSRGVAPQVLARALEIVPRPDLVIGLSTPRDIIEIRLRNRLGAQSIAERRFELGIAQTLGQIEAFDTLFPLLSASDIGFLPVSCPDPASLAPAVRAAVARIAALGPGAPA